MKFQDYQNTATTLVNGVLTLLDADEYVSYNISLPESSRAVLKLAAALKTGQQAEKLLRLFRQIKRPGLDITFAMINSLLAQGLAEHTAELLKDISPDNMSPRHKIAYAEILALRGKLKEAEKLIAMAYAADDTLKDAHARIAWKVFWPKKDYAKVIEWMERDMMPQ